MELENILILVFLYTLSHPQPTHALQTPVSKEALVSPLAMVVYTHVGVQATERASTVNYQVSRKLSKNDNVLNLDNLCIK